jgi:hypothetical protein
MTRLLPSAVAAHSDISARGLQVNTAVTPARIRRSELLPFQAASMLMTRRT